MTLQFTVEDINRVARHVFGVVAAGNVELNGCGCCGTLTCQGIDFDTFQCKHLGDGVYELDMSALLTDTPANGDITQSVGVRFNCKGKYSLTDRLHFQKV